MMVVRIASPASRDRNDGGSKGDSCWFQGLRGVQRRSKKKGTRFHEYLYYIEILLIELIPFVYNIGSLTQCFISFISTSHLERRT